jgi:hypothetical protein
LKSKGKSLLGKGKDLLLSRLEETTPGITKKIQILKAVEDIQNASGIKVGTYSRTGLVAGAGLTFGVLQGIITAILTSPEIAVPILRRAGVLKNSAAVQQILRILSDINKIPEGITSNLKSDLENMKLKVGLSIEDVSKKPTNSTIKNESPFARAVRERKEKNQLLKDNPKVAGEVKPTLPKVKDETTQSIQKAKASGKSFDEWVKGQGETVKSGDDIVKRFDREITKASQVKDFDKTTKLYAEQEKLLRKYYQGLQKNVDDINVVRESTCVECVGGADFVNRQMDKAIEIPKKGNWAKKIREEWDGMGGNGKNRIDDYDTSLYLTDEYLIFQESGIENFYKIENAKSYRIK